MSIIFLMSTISCSVRLPFVLPNCISTLGYFLSGDFREKIQPLVCFESPLIFALSLTDEQTFFNSRTIFVMFIFSLSVPSLALPSALLKPLFSRQVYTRPSFFSCLLAWLSNKIIFNFLVFDPLYLWSFISCPLCLCFPAGLYWSRLANSHYFLHFLSLSLPASVNGLSSMSTNCHWNNNCGFGVFVNFCPFFLVLLLILLSFRAGFPCVPNRTLFSWLISKLLKIENIKLGLPCGSRWD